jgi:methionyl-tRNA synthetase
MLGGCFLLALHGTYGAKRIDLALCGPDEEPKKKRRKYVIDGEIHYFTQREAVSFLRSYVSDLSKASENERKEAKPAKVIEEPKKPDILIEKTGDFGVEFGEVPEIADYVKQAVAIWEARVAYIAHLKRLAREDEEILILMGAV